MLIMSTSDKNIPTETEQPSEQKWQYKGSNPLYSFFNELIFGMGTKKMIELLASPLGLIGVFFVVISVALPLLPNTGGLLQTFRFIFFFIALGESYNIIGGYGGEVDFGHVVFFGIGGYAAAITYVNYGLNLWLAFLMGGVIAALYGLIIGFPILRLRGAYFAVAMLAIATITQQVISYFSDFTGGGQGISTGKILSEFGDIYIAGYYLMLVASILAFIITHYVSYSRLGLSLRAIKESPEGASSIGINVLYTKLTAFIISAFIAGIVGAFNITILFVVTPDQTFPTALTVQMIIITFIGGGASVFGPVIGAILLSPLDVLLTQMLAGVSISLFGLKLDFSSGYIIIYGLIFILAILYLPKGIMGYFHDKGWVAEESIIDKDSVKIGNKRQLYPSWKETEIAKSETIDINKAGKEPTIGINKPGKEPPLILEVLNIHKQFGGINAVDDVTLNVYKNELLGLIGPNGAGKTTLFNIISGYYKPTSGTVLLNQKVITGIPFHKSIKLGIARTFQLVHVFPNLTVMENVLASAFNGRRESVSYTDGLSISVEALEFIGLEQLAHQKVSNLVINEQKKLELARVLAADPDVILLDEIIAGLNPSETEELMNIIRRIRNERGKTIVFVEHVMKAVMSISDRIAVLDLGKLIADGSPKEISKNAAVINAYLGSTASEVSKYVEN